MAVLSDADRITLHAQIMRDLSDGRETCDALKVEVRQLIDDADAWADANAAAFNTAIRAGIRNKFTAQQKARALMFVIRRRWEVS